MPVIFCGRHHEFHFVPGTFGQPAVGCAQQAAPIVHVRLALSKIKGVEMPWKKIKFPSVIIANAIIRANPDITGAVLRNIAATVIDKPVAGIKNGEWVQLCMPVMKQY